MRPIPFGVLLATSLLASCSTQSPPPADAGSDGGADASAEIDTGVDAFRPPRDAGPSFDLGTTARPAPVRLPPAYDGTTDLPLIILIHADGVTGPIQEMYTHVGDAARAAGAYLVLPTGTRDSHNLLIWNDGITQMTGPDDVSYLRGVLDAALAQLPVDTSRVYFMGHSNGGFMAYRMACTEAARIAGIAVINAGDFPTATTCPPARPVSVLHIHGTSDAVTSYAGVVGVFAGAMESTQRWATRAGCDTTMTTSPALLDLDTAVTGAETLETDYAAGCTGARVSLMAMNGSGHIPGFNDAAGTAIVTWLLARSSPP